MDEFEESDLEKKTNDSHNTCYQSAAHKEKRHKNCKYGLFSLVFVIKLCVCVCVGGGGGGGGGDYEIFFVWTSEDKQTPEGLSEFIAM